MGQNIVITLHLLFQSVFLFYGLSCMLTTYLLIIIIILFIYYYFFLIFIIIIIIFIVESGYFLALFTACSCYSILVFEH